MPSKVRNPGSGKRPVNTPASGIPANGPGWAGPAKGFVPNATRAAPAFAPGNQFRQLATPERRREVEEDREESLALYREIMRDTGQSGLYRITAAEKLMDRREGKSVARNVTTFVDDATKLDDAALTAIASGQDADTRH